MSGAWLNASRTSRLPSQEQLRLSSGILNVLHVGNNVVSPRQQKTTPTMSTSPTPSRLFALMTPTMMKSSKSVSPGSSLREMSRLFSQSRKDRPKKTLFLILPDRKKETLHRIIVENVLPCSTLHTDEWKGYSGLSDIGFVHKTICHKRQFSQFEFDGSVATRVTINHIEGMSVELRTLKYMSMKDFIKYTWLEALSAAIEQFEARTKQRAAHV